MTALKLQDLSVPQAELNIRYKVGIGNGREVSKKYHEQYLIIVRDICAYSIFGLISVSYKCAKV